MRILIILITIFFPMVCYAQDNPFKSTPYPMPRFVSLASSHINVRAGPGKKYPITWVYTQKNRPVEIILEYDAWRKIRDRDGEEGWVHSALLSGRRFGLTVVDPHTVLYKKPQDTARKLLKFNPLVLVSVKSCDGTWCKASSGDIQGYIKEKSLWGVYVGEKFD